MRFADITIIRHVTEEGCGHSFAGTEEEPLARNFTACFPLFLVGEAMKRGCDFEDLADGFGPGLGTMGGDWSGIRDSTDEAVAAMLERALNHLFGEYGPMRCMKCSCPNMHEGRPA